MRKIDKNWLYNNFSISKINKLHHGKCFVWFFIHSLSCIRKLTHFLCLLVRFPILLNSWIKIVRTYFPWCNLYLASCTHWNVLSLPLTHIEKVKTMIFPYTGKSISLLYLLITHFETFFLYYQNLTFHRQKPKAKFSKNNYYSQGRGICTC